MIKLFRCHNFRNINIDNLEFGRINLLIGPNNSGKSNFIKALTMYSDILVNGESGSSKTAFLNVLARNGWEHTHSNRTSWRDPIKFEWNLDVSEKSVQYDFEYVVGDGIKDYNIVLEAMESLPAEMDTKPLVCFRCHDPRLGSGFFSVPAKKGEQKRRLVFSLDSQEILPRQFNDILLSNKNIYGNSDVRNNIEVLLKDVETFFRGFYVYVGQTFQTQKMREPGDINRLDFRLAPDASNFVNVFLKYKTESLRWKSAFERKMREMIPSLEAADILQIRNRISFALVIDGKQYDLSDVSEGTLKALILNMLINMEFQGKQSLLALDEPEANLHPAWQKVLGSWVRTTSKYEQIFIGTHSPDFLDSFTESFKEGEAAVFVFDSNSNPSVRRIVYEDIKDELGDWELGDLYRTNDPALGGWPW